MPTNAPSIRAACYLTGDHTPAECRALAAAARARGWLVGNVYTDPRPEPASIVQFHDDAKAGKLQALAVWDLPDLGRTLQEVLESVVMLTAVGVVLYIHEPRFSTDTEAGGGFVHMAARLVTWERTRLRPGSPGKPRGGARKKGGK